MCEATHQVLADIALFNTKKKPSEETNIIILNLQSKELRKKEATRLVTQMLGCIAMIQTKVLWFHVSALNPATSLPLCRPDVLTAYRASRAMPPLLSDLDSNFQEYVKESHNIPPSKSISVLN